MMTGQVLNSQLGLQTDRLWTQKEAAAYLGVSVSYIRASTCPKALLPSQGKRNARPLVRYRRQEVEDWLARHTARATSKG